MMKHLLTVAVIWLLSMPTVLANSFEFRYHGESLADGAMVTIAAEENDFEELACETNPSDDPNNGLILQLISGTNAQGSITLTILENTLDASLQWCVGTSCMPFNGKTTETKDFNITNGVLQAHFDALNIQNEGHLLATLTATIGGETHSVKIKFTNGEQGGDEDGLWWGYFTDGDVNADNFGDYGVNAQADYEAAIKIAKADPIMGKATVKAVRIWLNETTIPKITSLKVWKNKNLKVNANGVSYCQTVDLSTLKAGANDIYLNTPFSINDSIMYIGFTMTLNGQDNPIMCGGEYETNSFWFRATATGESSWHQVTDHGKLAFQVFGEGIHIPQNCAIVNTKNLGVNYYQVGDEAIIPITIKNKGSNPISSVSYTITTDNDPATTSPEITVPMNDVPFGNVETINVSFDTSEAVRSTKTFTITKVNGVENEASANDCVANGEFVIMQFLFKRVPVVEEFTGTWCGWCPRGFVGMEMAHEQYGDNVVLIAAHNGDPMVIADYNPIMNTVGGFPNSRVDRGDDVDPNPDYLTSAINQSLQECPNGMVTVTAKWNDENQTKIDIETDSKFAFAQENANYGVAIVLTNDGLSGTGSSWAQANYYSGQTSAPSYMSFWVNAGSSVSGVTYNHVAVAAWNILNGFNGSVNTSFEAGESMKFNYLADISSKGVIQDKSKLKVIALLIDRATGKIINAGQTTIKPFGTEVPSEFYLVGTFNEWNTTEEGGRLVFAATDEDGVYETEGTLVDDAEFKVITPNGDGWIWYGGVDETGAGYFLINSDLLNVPLTMVDGSNFHMEHGGKFKFRINANDMTLTVIPETIPAKTGDVNGDGSVNAADVTALYNFILNGDETYLSTSDVNNDGAVNAGDVTAVYNIILGNVGPSENVYVLGEVNGNTWGAATGVKMNTVDGKIFTVQVTTTTFGDYSTSYFALTKALASDNDNWDEIVDKRFGPTSDQPNFVISDSVLGQEIPLVTTNWKAFEAPTGNVYNLTVDLEHMTIVITKVN